MRFLLLSFLASTAIAVGSIECGTLDADASKTDYWFVSQSSCECSGTYQLSAKDATDVDNNNDGTGDAAEVPAQWWGADRQATGAGAAAACAYEKSPLKASSPGLDTDGLWDQNSHTNYEVKPNYIAKNDGTGYFKPLTATQAAYGMIAPDATDMEAGFMAFMEGELVDTTIYAAAKVGNLGNNAAQGDPKAFCSKATRKGFDDLSKTDNAMMVALTIADRSRCVGGSLTAVTSAEELSHNTVGDGAKKCWNLTWEAAPTAAAVCDNKKTCDRFVEGESQCIETTKLMDTSAASRAKATASKAHCMIQPNAGADDKYRHLDKAYRSQSCTVNHWCNPYSRKANADPVCLEHVIGDGTVLGQVRKAGENVTGSTTEFKWCLGVTQGAKKCTATEECNPHAGTRATLCINKTDSTKAGTMAFGALGADNAAGAATDLRGYCISQSAVGAVCGAATVCNYAGDGGTAGAVCLPHNLLLGEIAVTSPWTAVGQRKLPGVLTKYCLAANGTVYSSKICETTESCNPHAPSLSEVCIKTTTVLNHGEIAPEPADPTTDSKTACIGTSFFKQCTSASDTAKFVCNEGASQDADVCIDTTACVNEEEPLKGFYVAGVEEAADQKWCFATDGAAKCVLDEICNPSGRHGGPDNEAICVNANRRVEHGAPADADADPVKDLCLGKTGNAKVTDDQDGWLCDEGKGKFHDPKTKMEGRAVAPPPAEGDDKIANICFGKESVEECAEGVYCNLKGTEAGCSDAKCTVANICVTADSLIDDDNPFAEDGRSVCLSSDATAGENCTAEKMYCDQSTGACAAEAVSATDDPKTNPENTSANGAVAGSLAAAAVVAILSA